MAIAANGSAFAQTAEEADAQEPEIIVTASKRAESVLDVPSSVSVVSGAQLERMGATQLSDYAATIPGLFVDTFGPPGRTSITLRGIAAISSGSTVGTYLDDAPVGSSSNLAGGASFQLDLLPYDIERVEVLRGPQGTLYGAGAMGGLLKYVTRAPNLNEVEARAGGELFLMDASDDTGWGIRASVSVPIVTDRLAVRASYFRQHTPGYVDNPARGIEDENVLDQEGARLSLLWQATDNVSVRLAAMFQDTDSAGNNIVLAGGTPFAPRFAGYVRSHPLSERFQQELRYYSASVNWDLGFADFTSATSISSLENKVSTDLTGPAPVLLGIPAQVLQRYRYKLDKITQEFRLASPSGKSFEWMVGLFYTDEDADLIQTVDIVVPPIGLLGTALLPSEFTEYAAFGNFTYHVTDQFDLAAGIRWAKNKQNYDLGGSLGPPASGDSSENVVTWSVSPSYHITDDIMVYARAASGYRPGGPTLPVPVPNAPSAIDSDTLVNYELGFKSQLMDRRLMIELALYQMHWKDIQLTISQDGFNFPGNGERAKTKGVELAANFHPLDGLRLGATLGYVDAKLTDDAPGIGGLDGDRLPVPKWNNSFSADYNFAFTSSLEAQLGILYRYVGNRYTLTESAAEAPFLRSYSLLDFNAGISGEHWTVRFFAKNLTNKKAFTNAYAFGRLPMFPYQTEGVLVRPRTIGVSLDLKF